MSQPTINNQPLFYSAAEPLDKTRHASLGLKRAEGGQFKFAAQAYAVPLNAPEFNHALKSYPIIFTSLTDPKAVAALGIERDTNLFVNDDGTWLEGAYIPAYVRRYPFIFAEMSEQDQYALCVDRNSELVSETPDFPFFENGEMSEATRRAMEFCQLFQQQAVISEPILKELGASGLLTEKDLTIKRPDGSDQRIGGYIAVDEQRLATMSDEAFLDLRRKDILPYIYMHLSSLSNWTRLLDLHVRRQGTTGAPTPTDAPEGGETPTVS